MSDIGPCIRRILWISVLLSGATVYNGRRNHPEKRLTTNWFSHTYPKFCPNRFMNSTSYATSAAPKNVGSGVRHHNFALHCDL